MKKTALFLIVLILSVAWRVNANCVHPDVESSLIKWQKLANIQGDYFPALKSIWAEKKINGIVTQWLGVSWEGPVGGALFVLDCQGNALAASNIGAVVKITEFSKNNVIPNSIKAEYISGTGTGVSSQEFGIFTYDNRQVKTVFSHVLKEEDFGMPSEGGEEQIYTIRESADGKIITVSGVITKFDPDGKPTDRKTTNEAYCWTQKKIYEQCK
jgi:hypothetical protein